MARSTRLDVLMVDRGLAESRQKAQRLIMAGDVRVNGVVSTKAGHCVSPDAAVEVRGQERYVGRGGFKLQAALETFGLSPSGLICLDIGSSTGGFTDCMLQHGALRVHAVDVGTGQLAWKLRQDPRIDVREGVNARFLQPADFPEPPAFFSIDVSFISLKKVLPAVRGILCPGARGVALIKPQFEAGKEMMDKCRGVLKDRSVQERIAEDLRVFAGNCGFLVLGLMDSPLQGADGNREFLMALEKPES